MKTTGSNATKVEVDKTNLIWVKPDMILVNEKENPRTDYGNIEELMNSILENGIKTPLNAYPKDGKYILKNGFRRMRAVKMALEKGKKIDRIPLILEHIRLNDEQRTVEHLILNDGKPLTMLEQSEVIRRLMQFGWKVTDIVRETAKARGYIDNLILLIKAPMKVQNYIRENKISAHAVIQIMQAVKGDGEKAVQEVEIAIKAAKESGKEKATPKHVATKEVKNQSFGKFYKWTEEVVEMIVGRKDVYSDKRDVLEKMLVQFENGRPAKEVVELYFIDRTKAKSEPEKKALVAKKTTPASKAPAVKKSAKKPAKKAPVKKRK